jgi:outer membrane protein assembly factor BamB
MAAVVSFLSLAAPAHWPQWRGPGGDGVSRDGRPPVEWGPARNVVWKTPIAGEGHSSPVVWGDDLFLTTAMRGSGERVLLRLDARTGRILWEEVVVAAPVEAMHRENSPASSTAATDGTHVYSSFQDGSRVAIACHDFSGTRVWLVRPLRFRGLHGYSYTPLLHRDLVIVDCSQNDEAALIALDKRTGGVRWRFDRARKEISHVTPLLVNEGGAAQLITCGANELRAFDPETGRPIWWCRGPTDVCVAGLAFGDGVVFANGGYPRRTRMAVSISGRGDVSESHVRWSTGREVSYVPSPVYHEGHFYSVLDEGLAFCFDAKTGKAVWDHRMGGRFRSSLLLADGKLYASNDRGRTTVFRATPDGFQQVAVNDLDELMYATPAIAGDRLFIRTAGHLYCIGGRDTH